MRCGARNAWFLACALICGAIAVGCADEEPAASAVEPPVEPPTPAVVTPPPTPVKPVIEASPGPNIEMVCS